jgi:hypothetical protein
VIILAVILLAIIAFAVAPDVMGALVGLCLALASIAFILVVIAVVGFLVFA